MPFGLALDWLSVKGAGGAKRRNETKFRKLQHYETGFEGATGTSV